MENKDTVKLLRECDAGTKMAVSSIDEVLDKVSDSQLKSLLSESKHRHGVIGNELHGLLLEHGSDEKEPSVMAKGMSWIKTNVKLGVDDSDSTAADLITDGCNMGVKALYRYQNQYKAADARATQLCDSLIQTEEALVRELRPYL